MPDVYATEPAAQPAIEAARRIAAEVARPHAAQVDSEARFPREALTALGEAELYGAFLPAEVGGGGLSPGAFAAVVEELAQACGSTAMVYVMHVTAAAAIAASQTFAQRHQVLGEIVAGRHLTTLAFSERGSRSQFWAPVSKLEKDGSGYRTTAIKSWVTSAREADSYVSSGQKPAAQSPLESVLYLVKRDRPEVEIAGGFDGLGLRGNDSAPVALENLPVDAGELLTPLGAGADMMLQVVLPWFAVGTAAMAHGLCLASISATQGHLCGSGFEHDDSQLRDLPNLRSRLADMNLRAEQSRALLGRAVQAMLAPDDATPLLVLQSRLSALEAALDVTNAAMKACGGAAFSKHLAIERYFRDSRAGWVMAPTADHLREFIGRALVGLPLFG